MLVTLGNCWITSLQQVVRERSTRGGGNGKLPGGKRSIRHITQTEEIACSVSRWGSNINFKCCAHVHPLCFLLLPASCSLAKSFASSPARPGLLAFVSTGPSAKRKTCLFLGPPLSIFIYLCLSGMCVYMRVHLSLPLCLIPSTVFANLLLSVSDYPRHTCFGKQSVFRAPTCRCFSGSPLTTRK